MVLIAWPFVLLGALVTFIVYSRNKSILKAVSAAIIVCAVALPIWESAIGRMPIGRRERPKWLAYMLYFGAQCGLGGSIPIAVTLVVRRSFGHPKRE